MNKVFLATRKFLSDEEGVTAIEYGLIAALIAVAVIATVYLVGVQLNTVFKQIQTCLEIPSACGT
ncbi:MAG: Flp family type IVb pilin [Burkholderiaceae bacterium]|nr:Flp family type IVb pilin [Burkholderiaceae bacterium]